MSSFGGMEYVETLGPGRVFIPYVKMEELMDKLKLLNYEKGFIKDLRMRPLNRHNFIIPSNPGQQFFAFTSLAAWLIRKANYQFDPPQETDDPNATIASIMDHIRKIGASADFAPSRLKQGHGEHAIYVLNTLANEVLKVQHFSWKPPIFITETEENDFGKDSNDHELTLQQVEDDMFEMEEEGIGLVGEDEDTTEPLLKLEELQIMKSKPVEIMESNTDEQEWKLELERVLPQLKFNVPYDSRDWRSHLTQTSELHIGLLQDQTPIKTNLNDLQKDVEGTLEKVGNRERHLNVQLETLLMEFRSKQDQLSTCREQYRSVSGGVTDRAKELSQISEELETVKQEMEQKGSSMTDGSPLLSLRTALVRLRSELSSIQVQIGVAQHSLLQSRLRDKATLQRDLMSFGDNGGSVSRRTK